MESIKIAVVGIGRITTRQHLPNIAANPEYFYLWSLCDSDEKVLESACKKYQPEKRAKNIDEILSDEDVEGILIATPSETHMDLATRTLQTEKHILIEKPLALTIRNIATVLAHAKGKKQVLWTGSMKPFSPAVQYATKEIKQAPLDLYCTIQAETKQYYPQLLEDARWRRFLISDGCHAFNLFDYLVKSVPIKIHARKENVDAVQIKVCYENGSKAELTMNPNGSRFEPKEHIIIKQDGLIIEIRDFVEVKMGGSREKIVTIPLQYDAFLDVGGSGYDAYVQKIKARSPNAGRYDEYIYPNKGHANLLLEFAKQIREGNSQFNDFVNFFAGGRATYLTLLSLESIQTKKKLDVGRDYLP